MSEDEKPLEEIGAALGGLARGLRDAASSAADERPRSVELPSPEGEPLSPVRKRLARSLRDVRVGYRGRAASMSEYYESVARREAAELRGETGPPPPSEGEFTVSGRVTDRASGLPVPGLQVRVLDVGGEEERVLGSTRTDESGTYRVRYGGGAVSDEDPPEEIRIDVGEDEGAEPLRSIARSVEGEPGTVVSEEVAIDASSIPERLEAARQIRGVSEKRLEALSRRAARVRSRHVSGLTDDIAGLEDLPDVSPRLEEVEGIGTTFAERLRGRGIRDPMMVAEMPEEELAETLGSPPGRAKKIAEAARRIVRR